MHYKYSKSYLIQHLSNPFHCVIQYKILVPPYPFSILSDTLSISTLNVSLSACSIRQVLLYLEIKNQDEIQHEFILHKCAKDKKCALVFQ